MDPVNSISTTNALQDSRHGGRMALNPRRSESATDKVDVSARHQRAIGAATEQTFAVGDEAAARGLAETTMAQIVAMPALAARAQANGSADAVLDTLR